MNIAGVLKGLGLGDLVEKSARALDDLVVTEKELKMEQLSLDRAQIEVNKVEATHRSIWVAGWRPFIGWTCGAGILYIFLLAPVLEQIGFQRVEVDGALLLTLLGTLLGNAGLRTFEKIKGVNHR